MQTKDQIAPANAQSSKVEIPLLEHDRVELLNDGQRDCLRLVNENRTSKDIARLLDVSPHTVDMRIRLAMRTLNVTARGDAARMFAKYDIAADTAKIRSEAATTHDPKTPRDQAPTPSSLNKQGRNARNPVSISLPWGKVNTLTSGERLGWVTAIMIGSGISFTVFVAVLSGLKQAFD